MLQWCYLTSFRPKLQHLGRNFQYQAEMVWVYDLHHLRNSLRPYFPSVTYSKLLFKVIFRLEVIGQLQF